MKTAVINNREALVQGQLQPPPQSKTAGIPQIGRVITLLPGANLVDSKDLEELSKNEQWMRNFTTKIPRSPAPEQNPEKVGNAILELLEIDRPLKDGGSKKELFPQLDDKLPLSKLSAEVAKVLIDETLIVASLREWMHEEKRPELAHVISKRIAELEGTPEGGPAAVGR
jgi:hypothetical protein